MSVPPPVHQPPQTYNPYAPNGSNSSATHSGDGSGQLGDGFPPPNIWGPPQPASPLGQPPKKHRLVALLIAITAGLVALMLLVIVGVWTANQIQKFGREENHQDQNSAIGQPPPDFSGVDTQGKQIKLSELKTKRVWIVFEASWCGECRSEMAEIQAVWDKYGSQDLQIVSITNEDSADIEDYMRRAHLSYPHISDPRKKIYESYKVSAIPSHFFVGKDGNLKHNAMGVMSPEQIKQALDAMK